jgi:ABC-type multidrug transport system fused ATPase/permease subunit
LVELGLELNLLAGGCLCADAALRVHEATMRPDSSFSSGSPSLLDMTTTALSSSCELTAIGETTSTKIEIKDIFQDNEDGHEMKVMPNGYAPIMPANAPVRLSWKNLTIRSKKNPDMRPIINDISGTICGGLWAIMGSSGSGKLFI